MHCLELFAGCGGAALGLHAAGLHHVLLVERDLAAATTLITNGIGPVLCADVSGVDFSPWAGVDVLWASPPCQPYSSAGKGLGADDPRDGWSMVVRAIEQAAPTWVVVENVRGCPADVWADALRVLGYAWVEHRLLDAADYGLPQHRRRVFLVAGPRAIAWPLATHADPEIIRGSTLFPDMRHPWVGIGQVLTIAGQDMPGNGGHLPAPRSIERPSHTVSASCPLYHLPGPTISTAASQGVGSADSRDLLESQIGRRKLTPAECKILQGFPAEYRITGTITQQYRQIGNAVPPVFAKIIGQAVMQADLSRSTPAACATSQAPILRQLRR